jgi:hypothetical protein
MFTFVVEIYGLMVMLVALEYGGDLVAWMLRKWSQREDARRP